MHNYWSTAPFNSPLPLPPFLNHSQTNYFIQCHKDMLSELSSYSSWYIATNEYTEYALGSSITFSRWLSTRYICLSKMFLPCCQTALAIDSQLVLVTLTKLEYIQVKMSHQLRDFSWLKYFFSHVEIYLEKVQKT